MDFKRRSSGSLPVTWVTEHCELLLFYGIRISRGSDGKASAYNAGDLGSIPGSGRSSGEGNGNPLQSSCLENPMDGGAGRLQSMGSRGVGHDFTFTFTLPTGGLYPLGRCGQGLFTSHCIPCIWRIPPACTPLAGGGGIGRPASGCVGSHLPRPALGASEGLWTA